MDAEYIQSFFGKAAILSVHGTAYSVDVFYVSFFFEHFFLKIQRIFFYFQLKNPCPDYVKECVQTAIKLHKEEPPGDVLIFLTGKALCVHIDFTN